MTSDDHSQSSTTGPCRVSRLAVFLLVALASWMAACSAPAPAKTANQETYLSPLVRLQRLQGKLTHLHTDQVRYRESDSRLFLCSCPLRLRHVSSARFDSKSRQFSGRHRTATPRIFRS